MFQAAGIASAKALRHEHGWQEPQGGRQDSVKGGEIQEVMGTQSRQRLVGSDTNWPQGKNPLVSWTASYHFPYQRWLPNYLSFLIDFSEREKHQFVVPLID